VVQRVTVVKFGVYNVGCKVTGCFGIKIRTDAAKLTNARIARQCIDMVRECEVFVKGISELHCKTDFEHLFTTYCSDTFEML